MIPIGFEAATKKLIFIHIIRIAIRRYCNSFILLLFLKSANVYLLN